MSRKFKIGIQEFESCGKDIINLLNLRPEMEKLLKNVEITLLGYTSNIDWSRYPSIKIREEISETNKFDVILCIGSILPGQEKRIHDLRNITKQIVAVGACSLYGVRPSISTSGFTNEEWDEVEKVTKDKVPEYQDLFRKSVCEIVKTEYRIPGCPIDEYSFIKFIYDLIEGKLPRLEVAPVCWECKMKGNECIFMTKGIVCLGPITQSGCGARCPTLENKPCSGCGGLLIDANLKEWYQMVLKYGKTIEEVNRFFVSR